MRHYNPNKSIQATRRGIIITYADDKKSTVIPYDSTENIQLYGKKFKGKSYQEIDSDAFNPKQQLLYRMALYGLAVYTPEEVAGLINQEKFQIIKMQKRAQHVINVWKHDLTNEYIKKYFGKWFWNSDLAKEFTDEKYTDYSVVNNLSFKDLGITKRMIAEKLMEKNILPLNFFTLAA